MSNWEYRLVSVTATDETTAAAATEHLNEYGRQGWEAAGMSASATGSSTVLLKRALAAARASGGRM